MRHFVRRLLKLLINRFTAAAILIMAQLAMLLMLFYRITLVYQLNQILNLLSFVIVIYIINKDEDAAFKIAWIIVILVLPLAGIMMYLLCAGRQTPKKLAYGTIHASRKMQGLLHQDPSVIKELSEERPDISRMFTYTLRTSNFPVCRNTEGRYFASGEELMPVLISELEKAEKFIFLEYFIIGTGTVWDEILAVLKKKVSEGVEVKLIYDDFGCLDKLPWHYYRQLEKAGIKACRFNRIRPALIIQMNNRDHRKICVIDNKVGFTGGINLADEYMNRISRFGYWKDSAVMIRGEAVSSLTAMFLGMYTYLRESEGEIDYHQYLKQEETAPGGGYYQPFADTPTDSADVCLSMHLNMVNAASRYLYIDTPYLILNQDMRTALCLAAEKGVDVRILVPHIPDKKTVYAITRANYERLLVSGVRIYEYTPGFNHCKNIVCDDELGLIGSINTDYRSYFLHFEDGILIYDRNVAYDMKRDFLQAAGKSHEVTIAECEKVNPVVRTCRALLRVFTPLF